MLILEIILCVLSVAIIALLIVLLLKKQNKIEMPQLDLKEIGKLSNQIDNISKENKMLIESALSQEMLKLKDQTIQNSKDENNSLLLFKDSITNSLNQRFDALNKQMEDKLLEMNKKVDEKLQEGFKGTSETMANVRERLQAIDDAQKNIQELSKDVVSLKSVLEGNQTRGKFGEYQLQMVLHNIFGDTEGCYSEQYTMKKVKDGDNVRADAVVFMPEPNKMICIDSKFPFGEYAKTFETTDEEELAELTRVFSNNVKKHITDIKDKYIVDGKTAPEAIMFIPNDGVFAFIHHNCQDVVDYARDKKVIITSPSTLPAILLTINMVRIEAERAKNAKVISEQLTVLGKQFVQFDKEWSAFSRQLATATTSREKLDKRVSNITSKFEGISGSNISIIEEKEETILPEISEDIEVQ